MRCHCFNRARHCILCPISWGSPFPEECHSCRSLIDGTSRAPLSTVKREEEMGECCILAARDSKPMQADAMQTSDTIDTNVVISCVRRYSSDCVIVTADADSDTSWSMRLCIAECRDSMPSYSTRSSSNALVVETSRWRVASSAACASSRSRAVAERRSRCDCDQHTMQ